jgi:hypothetical protein
VTPPSDGFWAPAVAAPRCGAGDAGIARWLFRAYTLPLPARAGRKAELQLLERGLIHRAGGGYALLFLIAPQRRFGLGIQLAIDRPGIHPLGL